MRLINADEFFNTFPELAIEPYINTPTVEAEERKTGKWHQRFYSQIEMMVCSECNSEFSHDAETGVRDYNYCPNCGAKMGEVKDAQNKTS